jgi:hypothetical protein
MAAALQAGVNDEGDPADHGHGAREEQAEGETSARHRATARRLRQGLKEGPRGLHARHDHSPFRQPCWNADCAYKARTLPY